MPVRYLFAVSSASVVACIVYTYHRRWQRRRRLRPPITLTYYDMPGKAQAIRFALALGGRPFRDVRVTVEEYHTELAAGNLPFGSIGVNKSMVTGKVTKATAGC